VIEAENGTGLLSERRVSLGEKLWYRDIFAWGIPSIERQSSGFGSERLLKRREGQQLLKTRGEA